MTSEDAKPKHSPKKRGAKKPENFPEKQKKEKVRNR